MIATVEKGLRGLRIALRAAKLTFLAVCIVATTGAVVSYVVWTNASEEEKSRYRDALWAIERVLAPQKPSSSAPLSERGLNELLKRSMWPRHLHAQVKRVVICESARKPDALRDNGPRGLDVGLMQINNRAHAKLLELIGSEAKLLDPIANLNVGRLVFAQAGHSWEPWRASQSCHGLLPEESPKGKQKGKVSERLAAQK